MTGAWVRRKIRGTVGYHQLPVPAYLREPYDIDGGYVDSLGPEHPTATLRNKLIRQKR